MTNKRIFLDIHAIQTLPPSNINRDDTGSPKTAQYGGVRRARVSSQSWKRAVRRYFIEHGEDGDVGIRSLYISDYLKKKIQEEDESIPEEEADEKARSTLKKAGLKLDKDEKLKALFFLGEEQAKDLAHAAIEGIDDKKELQKILDDNPSVDLALFGRMLADDPILNEDASCQFAHAISTHAVQTEFDFFTAVDDLAPEDNAGAGMLGTVEYNSSTLYRYANVAVHNFYEQMNGDKERTIRSLKLFIEAFSNSLPTGKVNTFANQTLPQALVVTLRSDRPINLVSAFENPVKARDGYVDESIKRMFEEFKKMEKFADEDISTFYLTKDSLELPDIGEEEDNLKVLIEDFGLEIEKLI